jgi:pilus assembly protein CpaF
MKFNAILKEVQEYISLKYGTLVLDTYSKAEAAPMADDEKAESAAQIKRFIEKYLFDRKLSAEGMSKQDLIDKLYSEMAEFSFLTKYIFSEKVEEVNVNSWDDVEVIYAGGRTEKLTEHFDTPEHAVNVTRRILQASGVIIDNSSPTVLGHIGKNIRIAALKNPVVDSDVGVSFSIRIVNPQKLDKTDFVKTATATDEMLEFLSAIIRYGVSSVIAGATGSGKTTLCGWLLTTIPNDKRIYTIENGSRELDLVKRDKNGKILNKVIHTLTRESDDPKKTITQDDLLDFALRFHPDYIVVAEMRGSEANSAQEAARSGHAVITTVHSNSCESTWRRMVSLCKRAYPNVDDSVFLNLVTEAFPIVVYAKQLENKDRRIMEIMECEIDENGGRNYRSLYKYNIMKNRIADGKIEIEGTHIKSSDISKSLQRRLLENGMPQEELNRFVSGVKI